MTCVEYDCVTKRSDCLTETRDCLQYTVYGLVSIK